MWRLFWKQEKPQPKNFEDALDEISIGVAGAYKKVDKDVVIELEKERYAALPLLTTKTLCPKCASNWESFRHIVITETSVPDIEAYDLFGPCEVMRVKCMTCGAIRYRRPLDMFNTALSKCVDAIGGSIEEYRKLHPPIPTAKKGK